MNSITFDFKILNELPEDFTNPRAWPDQGVYRITDRFNNIDLYFVNEYSVEIAFDAFKMGKIKDKFDPKYDIPAKKIHPGAIAIADVLISNAKATAKGHT